MLLGNWWVVLVVMVVEQGRVVAVSLARGRDVLVVVVLFVLVVLGLVGVFSPTPYSRYGFSSNSYRWCQMLLSK